MSQQTAQHIADAIMAETETGALEGSVISSHGALVSVIRDALSSPAAQGDVANASGVMWGTSDEADFETGKWTFKMEPGFRVGAGLYAIVSKSNYDAAPPAAAADDGRFSQQAIDAIIDLQKNEIDAAKEEASRYFHGMTGLQERLASLTAEAERLRGGWQPIETAPRNDSYIVVAGAGAKNPWHLDVWKADWLWACRECKEVKIGWPLEDAKAAVLWHPLPTLPNTPVATQNYDFDLDAAPERDGGGE